ncbi:M1 family metallopeptidase [Solimicrobium silvestre]|uniref:Aminopeptidase n=1 Tax=Solimicrobium silvestre TaxID=2099400 RepID=A0A2S9H4Q1_9BURK|nr:M1 family metallopeptidase [Solimicrobium silvestre]PRC94959.1 Aminopeptidase N [Solimicrobium silvestre]
MLIIKKPSETGLIFTKLLLCSAVAATLPYQAAFAETSTSLVPYSFTTTPGRLPKNVIPTDYVISITPDAAQHQLTGTETVSLEFTEAVNKIQFNSLNQTLSKVLFDGKPVKSVESDDKAQLTTVILPTNAKVGKHQLTFAFTGKIETDPHGLFVQEYTAPDGTKDMMLSSKFEATDARRMFPCWDEPAFRATYQLNLTAPAAWTAIANMPVASRKVNGTLATTSFERSPKMPTYLVHVSAGNLGMLSGESEGTKLNIVAAKGQEQNGAEALANAKQILADYNAYFGYKFPLPKLDSIAVPGGFQGGMENWGAITYNDQALLLTPSSSKGQHQSVYSIQAHEMAHQWFGDLVTMGWWDELWLNESFASWRAAKETDLRHPDWHWWESQDASKEDAMSADANVHSHPILQHVTNELEATSAFDPSITYNKGQAVLRMIEAYLGPDVFRDGIRQYMKAHAFSNTTSADLWQALSKASGKNVAEIVGGWTTQAGFPLVSVQSNCDANGNRSITLNQQQFLASGNSAGTAHWNIPLQIRTGTSTTAKSVLLTKDGQTEAAGKCEEALSVNADTVGYYRTNYDAATLQANNRHFSTMSNGDRIALLDDQWALVKAGKQNLSGFFALASAMGTDQNLRSWQIITEALGDIEHAERGTPGYDAFVTYARSIIKPLANQLGWENKAGETPGIQRLRRTVLSDLGAWGDADVIAEARARFALFVKDRTAIPVDNQGFILAIVALNASGAEFEQLHALAKSAKNETEMRRYYPVMMLARDPAVASKASEIVLSDEIPKQADGMRLQLALTLSEHNPDLSWSIFTKNYERLIAPYLPEGTTMMASMTPDVFWNSIPLDQVETWIKANAPEEVAPLIARGMEAAHTKLAQKTLLNQATDAFLQSKAVASK